jgi:hypothetical protein
LARVGTSLTKGDARGASKANGLAARFGAQLGAGFEIGRVPEPILC